MRYLVPALIITLAMVMVYLAKVTMLMIASMAASLLMVMGGILTEREARKAINWDIYVTIGSAIGVGRSMVNSILASGVARMLLKINRAVGMGDAGLLDAVYFTTSFVSNVVTNHAAAAILFPAALDAVIDVLYVDVWCIGKFHA
jgi:di/tricarboxylate transporter